MRLISDVSWRQQAERLASSAPLLSWGRSAALKSLGVGFDHVREVHDIDYGAHPRQSLDLFFPAGRSPTAAIVFVHGGSWRSGHKNEYRFVGRSLAAQGWAVAVVGYRLFPDVRFPDFVHDVASAVEHLRRARGRLAWPDLPIWLAGHSAGGHIAALAGMSAAFWNTPPVIGGVIALSAPFSFLPERDPLLWPVFGPRHAPQGWYPMCPIDCVGRDHAPLLVVHGDQDRMVSWRGAERMVVRARAAGQVADLLTLEGQGHFQPLLAFHPRMPGHARLMDAIGSRLEGRPA